MALYGLANTPLLEFLRKVEDVLQVWLADDATAAGKIVPLKNLWDKITSEGQKYGYHVNESKSWIIIKNGAKLDEAKQVFAGTSIQFTTAGKRYLGAAIDNSFKEEYRKSLISTPYQRKHYS